ncbi:LLM class flavin-dependent oxidoreductase [Actinomyces oris]|uniref:LLM class flavin-dependent oxidoreductase n=1 Tax=Actinomyces oris TaxID=544580 RepID=UPI003D2F418C
MIPLPRSARTRTPSQRSVRRSTGEHHNPPFAPSSPTTLLANIAARTDKLLLTTATTLITTNDPVRLAEEYAYLQHLSDGRVDLMMGRGNTGP